MNLVNVEVHGQTVGAFVDVELTNAFGTAASKAASKGVEQHEHLLRRHGPWPASDRFERLFFSTTLIYAVFRVRMAALTHEHRGVEGKARLEELLTVGSGRRCPNGKRTRRVD